MKQNPFDLHVNRLKHDVLGKRRNYEKGGKPLQARTKAIEKRKRTLLKELQTVFKKNTFIDRRLGENDPHMTEDEKLSQRLIVERSKIRAGKDSRYNLNDDEELTHFGQSLSKSEELNQRPVIDDADDEDVDGRIRSEHFFGGFNDNKRKIPQTKQEWIDDMIRTTKQEKYERQRENEKVFDLTETLDEQWKALSAIMGIKDKTNRPIETKEPQDDYDRLVNTLKYEAKTTGGAPLKSAEDLQKEASERIKTLQIEEANRMQPAPKSILSKRKQKMDYCSVEELDESYYIMDGSKKHVSFDDEGHMQENGFNETTENNTLDENSEEQEDENGDFEDKNGNFEDDNGEFEDENSVDESENKLVSENDTSNEFSEIPTTLKQLKIRLKQENKTFEIILKRIKDPRLPPLPKTNISNYFELVLDYYCLVTSSKRQKDMPPLLNRIAKHLFELIQLVNNTKTRTCICDRLKNYKKTINEQIAEKKYIKADYETSGKPFKLFQILFLKLIGLLYPTSDFRHPIATPAFTLLAQLMNSAVLSSLSDCKTALMLCELVQQWTSKSHRYVPEVMLLLIKLLQLACPENKKNKRIHLGSSKQISDDQLLILRSSTELALVLRSCLLSLTHFIQIYSNLSAISEIIEPFRVILDTIKTTYLCDQIVDQCKTILIQVDNLQKIARENRVPLVQGKQRPQTLRLFEPRFGMKFDGKKNNSLPKEYNDRLRLRQKYKREHKSATREIRRDNQFIAREQLNQQMSSDSERKRKIKMSDYDKKYELSQPLNVPRSGRSSRYRTQSTSSLSSSPGGNSKKSISNNSSNSNNNSVSLSMSATGNITNSGVNSGTLPQFDEKHAAAGNIFEHRQDWSILNRVPLHKRNAIHIRLEDEGPYGNDETRCFVLSQLSVLGCTELNCI
ncbi:unnamed protein product, partial [Didymodactylos carnosus]